MVPVIANGGTSFKGAFLYYNHDKGAQTSARVAWTETVNLMTDCAKKAWKVMAYTAKSAVRLKEAAGEKRTGRKLEKPVFAYSLSWHPEQKPDKETMLEAARLSLEKLGLSEHETMIVAHQDEPQPHLHCIVNRCHPLTGKTAKMNHSKRKLSDFAREWEHMEGKVYCMKREENYQKRQKGKITRYGDPVVIEAWKQSSCGQSLKDALATKGYDLAQGRKRLVVVDPHGKTFNPIRQLPDVRAQEFNERMIGFDHQSLPTPEEILSDRAKTSQQHPQPTEPEAIPSQDHDAPTVGQDFNDRMPDYEKRVTEANCDMGERHSGEWEDAQERKQERINSMRLQLTERYRLEKRQDAIDALQAKLDAPGLVPKFARRLFGMDRKRQEKLQTLRATQDKAKDSFDEAMRTFEKQQTKAIQNLETRHAREQRELSERLKKWRPSSLAKEFNRSRSDHARTQDYERPNDGPSLSR